MSLYQQIHQTLRSVATGQEGNPKFFKTGKGEYAEHDQFIGISVPVLRKIAIQFKDLGFADLSRLLRSRINEERLLALFILVKQYQQSDVSQKETIYQFYLSHLAHVNNWNLVDSSAHYILGDYLLNSNKDLLLTLATSESLWERRIAIIATWHFIKQDKNVWTIKIAKILLRDPHDLIHKAVGWMLREMGKKDEQALKKFLDKHAHHMPRTMLRYAIEKFSEDQRQYYLKHGA